MIHKPDVMPLLLAASPSFEQRWKSHVAEPSYEPGLLYVDLSEYALHALDLKRTGAEAELRNAFEVIERLHVDGDDYVREAATIGFLEDLQNLAEQEGTDPKVFAPYLGPQSRYWWTSLSKFWSGESPRVE